jgi:putative membrane protein
MELINMKKVNVEVALKLVILTGFSLFYYILIRSDKITLYVHPRIVPFIKVSIVAMMIIVLFLIFDILKARTVKKKMRNYIIFIIPFVMMLGMKPNNNRPTVSSDNSSKFSEDRAENLNISKREKIDDEKINFGNKGQIEVTDSNYVTFLKEIGNNIDDYLNKEVEIVGFVYREEGMKENQFALVRNMMVCCSADMQMVGLICDSAEANKYDANTWVKVNGTLELNKEKDKDEAVIKIKNIEKVKEPKKPYVYPY